MKARRVAGVAISVVIVAFLLPACQDSSCSEGPGVSNALADVDRWVLVTAVEGTNEADGTNAIEMKVSEVTPEREGTPHSETILIHRVYLDGLEDALDEGTDAYIALTTQGDEPHGMTSYILTRSSEGEHRFPGLGCFWEGDLRGRMGDRYDETLDALIGLTSSAEIKRLLAQGMADDSNETASPFSGDPIFEGGPGASATFAPDEWKVGDFFVCRGVGSSTLLGPGTSEGIEIEGFRVHYLDGGGLRVTCERA